MTAVATRPPDVRRPARAGAVLGALAREEARRMLRNPVLAGGLALSTWMLWGTVPRTGDWPGSAYAQMSIVSVPLQLAISLVVAASFHRERVGVGAGAPVREPLRMAARLLAALPLVGLAAGFAGLVAWRQRQIGGLWLGVEPGRTTEALHTPAELAQHVALAVVAVGIGALLGRRMSRLVSVIPLLFVLWFLVSTYWLFSAEAIRPVSIVQVQPIDVRAGPPSADPLSFPEEWLLTAPDEFTQHWSRSIVSPALAWCHGAWLLGSAALCLAGAGPRRPARRWLLVGGSVTSALAVLAQVLVSP